MDFSILYMLQKIRNPLLDQIMVGITSLGNAGIFWILLGIVLLIAPKTRKAGLAVLISLAAGFLIGNLFLKNLVARSRPCWIDQSILLPIAVPKDYSFPSGHSLASFEAAVSVFCFHKKWGKVLLVLAVLIAFSRLYLFVHFPTDVLAGAVLGTLIAFFVCKTRFIQSLD